mmetsp:Transcript_4770/g.11318  ORF Transcript_4770/g.11318 Transcript_4770/m.11318 type:complete len:118 (-) Transcript_4770:1613-1966(-)
MLPSLPTPEETCIWNKKNCKSSEIVRYQWTILIATSELQEVTSVKMGSLEETVLEAEAIIPGEEAVVLEAVDLLVVVLSLVEDSQLEDLVVVAAEAGEATVEGLLCSFDLWALSLHT